MKVGDLVSGPGSGHFESWGFGIGSFWKVGDLDRTIFEVGDFHGKKKLGIKKFFFMIGDF